jgi:hypothetical protein
LKTQTHDYDPGIVASGPSKGLFWTIAIPDDAVEADLEEAEARLHLSNLSITDYFDIPNALFHNGRTPVQGTASFDLRWFDALKRGSTSKPTLPFEQEYVQTSGHISWSGTTAGDTFHTTDGVQTVEFAQIANERNGFFFGRDEDDD